MCFGSVIQSFTALVLSWSWESILTGSCCIVSVSVPLPGSSTWNQKWNLFLGIESTHSGKEAEKPCKNPQGACGTCVCCKYVWSLQEMEKTKEGICCKEWEWNWVIGIGDQKGKWRSSVWFPAWHDQQSSRKGWLRLEPESEGYKIRKENRGRTV